MIRHRFRRECQSRVCRPGRRRSPGNRIDPECQRWIGRITVERIGGSQRIKYLAVGKGSAEIRCRRSAANIEIVA